MSELIQAFILGNSAILTNVCILPLYPGLMAYMAGSAQNEGSQKALKWMGALVLAGVLTLMILIGGLLYLLQQSFGSLLTVLLPIIYLLVILLGGLMVAGRNPFNQLSTMETPILKNPYVGAYVYGLMLGPMTLPCAGPIVVSAFLLGAGNFVALSESLLYFLFFGLGFGWPLVLLPLVAGSLQRRFTGWMTQNYGLLTRIAGILLIAIGLFGIFVDWLPNVTFG